MQKRSLYFIGLPAILLMSSLFAGNDQVRSTAWKKVDQGLYLGTFVSPQKSRFDDSLVRVLRIDPKHYQFKLVNASATIDKKNHTARAWSKKYNMVAAINSSMYQRDYLTSVSLMRTQGHINNPRLSRDKTVMAFGRKDKGVPKVMLIDRQCDDFDKLKQHYRTLVQSIRMFSCHGRNVWQQQVRQWSTAAIGMDKQGRVLFIHVRSPYSTHDLINILMKLPIGMKGLMYVEGGPEAQLYIKAKGVEYEWFGSFETGFNENNKNAVAWPIPNVIGIVRR